MSDDEYIVLLEEARDALHDLCQALEPGTGWKLHEAYTMTKAALKQAGVTDEPDPEKELRDQRQAERDAQNEAWKSMPRHERERLVLDALADGRRVKREIVERINAAREDIDLYESQIDSLIKNMLIAGEIEREKETFKNKPRWRYFRKAMSGPIAELNRALEA